MKPKWRPFFRRSIFSFLVRFVLATIFVMMVFPSVLLLVYRIETVHPISTLMLRDGLFGPGAKREWVEIEDITPALHQSVLMSEDGKFCSHNGVDWEALNAVIGDAIDGEKTRGASTLTMQLAKNLFLWPGRSYVRKALEIPYALMTDFILPKKRIMEIYLNIAEWDEGVFGSKAAAKHYFNRDVAKLTRKHAALLTVTLPNPKGRNAAKPTRRMNRTANIIQRRARASGAYVKCLK